MLRPALAPGRLDFAALGWRAAGRAALDGSQVELNEGELTLGDVRVQASGGLERNGSSTRLHARASVLLAACDRLLSSAPKGFLPMLDGMALKGTFAGTFEIDRDTRLPDKTRVKVDVHNDCLVTEVPEALDPRRFRSAWTRQVQGVAEVPMTIESGPGSANWVPYDSISHHMETAVLVSEDGGFDPASGLRFSSHREIDCRQSACGSLRARR